MDPEAAFALLKDQIEKAEWQEAAETAEICSNGWRRADSSRRLPVPGSSTASSAKVRAEPPGCRRTQQRAKLIGVRNDQNDVVDWLKVPHVRYGEQCELIKQWLDANRGGWRYIDRILAVRGDSTGGTGDAPSEILMTKTDLPMGQESFHQITLQSENALYLNFEAALFRDEGDPLRFSYPVDHPLAPEFEEQMVALVREYKGDGEYLSAHHPDEQGAKDDAPDQTALMLMGAASGLIGEILFG